MKYQHLIFAPFATGDALVVGKTLAEVTVLADVVALAAVTVFAEVVDLLAGSASTGEGETICNATKERKTVGIREMKVTLSVSLN
jgi:hypothetical protein